MKKSFQSNKMVDKFYYRFSLLLNLVLIIILVRFYRETSNLNTQENDMASCISEKTFQNDVQPNVNIFDMSKPLLPESIYNSIQCKKSAPFIVTTTLCYHTPLGKDTFVR